MNAKNKMFIFMLLSLFFVPLLHLKPIQADDTNNIEIVNLQVQPSTIKIGNTFTITATLVNNSPVPIFVQSTGLCGEPFTATFDSHVVVKDENLTCFLPLIQQILNPGEKTTRTGPSSMLVYQTTTAGTTNATVTFLYDVKNQTHPNLPNIEKTISKSFLFTINDNSQKVKTVNTIVLSPLKQLKSGVLAKDIVCKQGLQLILKTKDGSPACVKPDTVNILAERGWTK